ncbi:restriction endonuclease subunit S [Prevotella histicola]
MEYVKLGDICTKVCSGGTPTSSNPAYYDGNIPWLNTNEVNFCNIYSTNKTISEEGLKKSAAKYVPENTVIVAMYGVTAGKCAIAKIPLTTNQACCNLIIDKEKADYCYVYYYLRQQSDSLNKLAIGGAQQNLNALTIKKFKIALPTLPTQQKIASILSAYDRLIENNTRRIRLLEQMAENIYKEWFVRFRFPEHEKVEMVNGLPKGWKIKRIADFGRIETGKTPPMSNRKLYGGDILFVKTPDMHDKMFISSTSETLSEDGNNYQLTKLLPANSIMVSCIGTAGIVSINAKPAHTNQQINSIILNNLEDLEWLYYVCKQMKPTIELFGATGATMTNLSKGKFEKLKVVVPKANIRESFHKRIRPYFKEIFTLDQQNTLLTRQRDLLLPRLMSGKLEVKS